MTTLAFPASRRTRLAGWLAVAATAGFAAWAGASYLSASSSPVLAQGQARDAALGAGTREIAELNTVSVRQVAAWERRWLADTTGPEHARIQQTNAAAAAQIARVQTSSAGTVTGAALTGLDTRTGTARLIATVSVLQTAASGTTNTVTNRYQVALTLTTAGWKISSLTAG
jgi:Mce-associated membrane protein